MTARLTENTHGALLMTLSMAAYTLGDTFMKSLSSEMSLSQALFLRSGAATILIFSWAAYKGQLRTGLTRSDKLWMSLRASAEVSAAFLFLTAVFNMPLANATAILQALPLTVTIGGALFYGERVGWRRVLAIAIGFIGVMLILRPGPAGFNPYAGLALLAVLAITMRDLVTRKVSGSVPSVVVAIWSTLLVTVCSFFFGFGETWVMVSPVTALQLAGAVVCSVAAYLLSIRVMRVGNLGFTAPFRYTGLLWALVLGLLVFGDWPDDVTLVGAAIVVATGIFTLYRERVRASSEAD